MTAMLPTRTNPAVRTARPSAAHRTRHAIRTDDNSGAVTVRGRAHSPRNTLARRATGGGSAGVQYGTGRVLSAADSATTLTLRGILPARREGKDAP
ncbi:hypothetical protein VM98_35455, partial [Streptomyces rubellomurinus subsp. indigoferus]